MNRKLFLPGAGGSAQFWQPVVARLPAAWDCHLFAWPGLGSEPHRRGVTGIDDLVELVLAQMGRPTDLIAQSMGGLVAIKIAIKSPDKVRRLILTGTSVGLPVEALGGMDWRPQYRRDFPQAARWITEIREDFSAQLSSITAPTMLLWGDQDAISPRPVGERLANALPNAVLRIIKGGGHDFPITHSDQVAELVYEHLR